MQIVDHTQTIGGIQSNYWGDISPIPPRVSAPLIQAPVQYIQIKKEKKKITKDNLIPVQTIQRFFIKINKTPQAVPLLGSSER